MMRLCIECSVEETVEYFAMVFEGIKIIREKYGITVVKVLLFEERTEEHPGEAIHKNAGGDVDIEKEADKVKRKNR